MKISAYILVFIVFQSCKTETAQKTVAISKVVQEMECNEHGCHGKYEGAEFINGADIAHQFSNKMSVAVGNELKKQYQQKNYKSVNFDSINMTTKGMGSGHVIYTLSIPFVSVNTPCEAYTSFDHCGGWNHEPNLERRKNELRDVILQGQKLEISALKTTPEGLQEYWIQWKNKEVQKDCK